MTLRISKEQANIISHALLDYSIKKCSEASECFGHAVVEDRANNFLDSEIYHVMGEQLEQIAMECDLLVSMIEEATKR